MVALACGSASTTRTEYFARERPPARFIVVVVFPQPPFWFAIATMIGMRLLYDAR